MMEQREIEDNIIRDILEERVEANLRRTFEKESKLIKDSHSIEIERILR